MPATSPARDNVVNTIEVDDDAAPDVFEDEENAIVLDPNNSERQYYKDPFTGLLREIWRPGDGDGDKAIDYYDWQGPPVPLEKRWRLYQSNPANTPIKRSLNSPPKYVILDDLAAHALLISDIPRKHLADYWGHDFGGPGKIRARRPHRGRGAVGDPGVWGDDKYYFTLVGAKDDRYYFTGEKDYRPVIYRISADSSEDDTGEGSVESTPTTDPAVRGGSGSTKRKQASGTPSGLDTWKRPKYGHNQHTPKHLMVKHGAPSYRRMENKRRERLSRFLVREASPEVVFDKKALYSQTATKDGSKDWMGDGEGFEELVDGAESLFEEDGEADEGMSITSGAQKETSESGVMPLRAVTSNQTDEGTNNHAENDDIAAYIAQLELELKNARQAVKDKDTAIDLLTKAPNEATTDITDTEEQEVAAGEIDEDAAVEDSESQGNAGKGTFATGEQTHQGQEEGFGNQHFKQVTDAEIFTVLADEASDGGGSQGGIENINGAHEFVEPAPQSTDKGDGN